MNIFLAIFLMIGGFVIYCCISYAEEKQKIELAQAKEKQKEQHAKQLAKQREVQSCQNRYDAHLALYRKYAGIADAADNPEKFFDALAQLEEHVSAMGKMESSRPDAIKVRNSDMLQRSFSNQSSWVDGLIDRYWAKEEMEIASLQLPVAKARHVISFVQTMKLYEDRLTQSNIDRIQQHVNEASKTYYLTTIHYLKARE